MFISAPADWPRLEIEIRRVSGELVCLASVLIPNAPGAHQLRVRGCRPVGAKTEEAGEVLVALDIFFGSFKSNGISAGFAELEEESNVCVEPKKKFIFA